MMLEQSLISPNFLGKESFRWFIGVCTKYSKITEGGYKVKVRIIGYHPDAASVIKDDELPWAHVLVPLNMGSGTGATGISYNARGGEHVIGFFMDGDNGQQPVIIGSLFTGSEIQFPNTWDKGTNNFSGYKQNTKPLSSLTRSSKTGTGNPSSTGIAKPAGTIQNAKGEDEQTQGSAKTGDNGQVISIPPVCDKSDSTYSGILQALRDFIKTLNTINQVTSIINSVTNAVANIPSLIQDVASALKDLFAKYCKKIRDKINAKIYKLLSEFFNSILPKDIKLFKQLIVDKAIDNIWCIFDKIIKGLSEFIIKFLTNIVDKVISVPLCAAESFVGSLLSTVTSQITEAIGPALSEITSAIGGVIGPISSYVSQALGYANAALSFLSCELPQCKQQFDYKMNKGWIPQETIENINNTVNYPNQLIQNGKKAAEDWLGLNDPSQEEGLPPELQSQLGGCDVTSLECGLPTVTFFGGGGVGAAGLAVVDSIGRVSGVNITSFGTGYSQAPYISFDDPCNNGIGAAGFVYVQDGKVTKVEMTRNGYGYLNATSYNSGFTDPCSTPLIDSSGVEVIGYVTGLTVVKPGFGYKSSDLISDIACPNDLEIYPVVDNLGRIIDFNIINPGTIRVTPDLVINSDDGEGAVIRPVLEFKPVEKQPEKPLKVNKVVLCSEDHGL